MVGNDSSRIVTYTGAAPYSVAQLHIEVVDGRLEGTQLRFPPHGPVSLEMVLEALDRFATARLSRRPVGSADGVANLYSQHLRIIGTIFVDGTVGWEVVRDGRQGRFDEGQRIDRLAALQAIVMSSVEREREQLQ